MKTSPCASAASRTGSTSATATLILVRHGETAWNVARRMQGHRDIPLNESGRRQAALLASAVIDGRLAGHRVSAVFSSDLSRARDTAVPLAGRLGLPVIEEPGLRERCYGGFEGYDEAGLRQSWPEQHARWAARDPDFAPAGGESMLVLRHRILACLDRLARAHIGATAVCVTHGGVLDIVYRHAQGLSLEAARQHALLNASLNIVAWQAPPAHDDMPGAACLIRWAEVAHLRSAEKTGSLDDDSATAAQP